MKHVLTMLAALCALSSGTFGETVIRVSPDGPLSTPQAARDEVRRLKALNGGRVPDGGLAVVFADGEYALPDALELDARDGGTPEAPVVWRAAHRGRALFSGARKLTGWRRLDERDAEANALIPPTSRAAVRVADVPDDLDLPDFHGGSEECYAKRLNYPLWPYQDGRRLDGARFPNRPPDPHEQKPGYLFTGILTRGRQGAEFKLRGLGAKLAVWAREPDLWTYGLFLHEYADMKMRVAAIDVAQETMRLDNTWYPRGFNANRPFHVFNAFSELDVPGEWVFDRTRRRLYLLPVADVVRTPPVLGTTPYLVKGTNVAHVVFDGLAFRYCRRDALRFDACRAVTVRASTFAHTGAWGVTVQGGADCRVEGCDLTDLGEGGVRLAGGDWATRTPARHVADNNHISYYGEVIPSYRPGVSLSGVGNRCTHNLIHHTRHQAVWFNGNDHVIGFNVIHDTCLYNDDAGAIYCCQRDFTKRGTVIAFNLVHATGKRPYPTNVHGIYLDDWSSGTIVCGNILNGATFGLHFGGGQATVATNNLVVSCERWCHLGTRRWPQHFPNGVIGADSPLYRKLAENAALWETAAWKGAYPHLLDPLAIEDKVLAHDPIACVLANNLFWACAPVQLPPFREILPYLTVTNNVACTNDPGFVDYAHMDFNLKPGSPAWRLLGGNSRFDEMGLYDSPFRASPKRKFGAGVSPVEMRKGRPREMRPPAVIRIDVVVDTLPDGVRDIARDLDNAFILASSKGKRIVGFSETDEAPHDGQWERCAFSFVPNFDGAATIALSGRFGQFTDYRNVNVTGAQMDRALFGTANHDHQKAARLAMKKGVRVTVEFEAHAHPDDE